jgi:hypothetical protein
LRVNANEIETFSFFLAFGKRPHHDRAVQLLAQRIQDRLAKHKFCIVFEGELDQVWPRKQSTDPRIPLIEKFAREHGWSVRINDPGIRATFRKVAAPEPAAALR